MLLVLLLADYSFNKVYIIVLLNYYIKMNRKAIEGMPLKYIIIAIIAALVITVMVNVTNVIGDSVSDAAGMMVVKLNESITQMP